MKKPASNCFKSIILSITVIAAPFGAAANSLEGIDLGSQQINPVIDSVNFPLLEGAPTGNLLNIVNGSNDIIIGGNIPLPPSPPPAPTPQPTVTMPEIDNGGTGGGGDGITVFPDTPAIVSNPGSSGGSNSGGSNGATLPEQDGGQQGDQNTAQIRPNNRGDAAINCGVLNSSSGVSSSGGCVSITPPGGGGNNGGGTPPAGTGTTPDINLIEVLQSSVIGPVGGITPPTQDLFFAGATGGASPDQLAALAPAGGQLTPEQLGALSPAAGGGAGQGGLNANDESIACMNSYLQNGWASAELRGRCGGAGGDSDI
ncbi:MAG: hypothetical protein SFW63_02375 [Alphaproteobacteria bacterium]|nr:hypothetical protein [Alphaproteobacteria bacterium]